MKKEQSGQREIRLFAKFKLGEHMCLYASLLHGQGVPVVKQRCLSKLLRKKFKITK